MSKHHLLTFAPLLLFLGLSRACHVGEPSIGATNSSIYLNNELCSGYGGSANCTATLAVTQTTEDSSCAIAEDAQHRWPLGGSVDQCHGWSATDTGGSVHYNSANNIQCSCDGQSMTYVQYPNTVNCSGTGHPKKYSLNQCTQGVPPRLYDRATDLSCCVPSDDCVSVIEEATAAEEQQDWLQSGVEYLPALSEHQKQLWVTIGMSPQQDCSDIGNRTVLKLYVGPTLNQTCQGWNHYLNPYPDTSVVHQNSAIRVQCQDGGITYTQYTNIDCTGQSPTTKTEYYNKCHQGMPPTVYTELLDFSGCLSQGFKP